MHQKIIDKRYKILRKIGSGAMGDVYKIRDLKDNRIIALKMISKKMTDSEAVKRFRREFRLLAGLKHPNLCAVYDFGTLKDGRSYYTMEYVDGPNIFEFIKKLPYEEIYPVRKDISNGVYPLIVQLCRVLEYIHSKGLIHYDIKPGNILIETVQGRRGVSEKKSSMPRSATSPILNAKLLDFGLAGEQKIKGGAIIKGTFPYIAPEVIKGLAVDHRADLFSLGVLLYEIFTRKRFPIKDKESFVSLFRQQENIVSELPSKIIADIPKRLERLIMRLLELESGQRFGRANEVIKEINRISGKKFEIETKKTLESYLLSSKFVGREKEMDLLISLYDKARHGEGKVILITGEAGIGKSRLLKEFKIFTQLRRGYSFIGYTHQEKTCILEPFHDIFYELINYIKESRNLSRSRELKLSLAILFKIFPDLANGYLKRGLPRIVPLDPQQEKFRNFEAISELLGYITSHLGELVILLEDLHWADDATIQCIEYLVRNLGKRNILICGTCRSAELEQNQTLNKMIINLKKEDYFSQIELKPLNFKNLCSFLDSTITPQSNSPSLVKYLLSKTGGNPYFVEEIIRTLMRTKKVSIGERIELEYLQRISIPETIEDVVSKRFRDLDSNSKNVIKYGALLLKDFSYEFMSVLTGLSDIELSKALWKLKSKQILIEKDNTYQFYHATLREAVSKNMEEREKRKLNYQIGATLEKINRRNIDRVVEDLAYYFIDAKDYKKGVRYGLWAAKKSSEKYANEQALQIYRGLLSLLTKKKVKLRFYIFSELAELENLVGHYDAAISYYNKALGMKAGTVDKKIKICLGVGVVYLRRGEHHKMLPMYQKSLRMLKKMKMDKLKPLLEATIKARICRAYIIIGDLKSVGKFNLDVLNYPKKDWETKEAMGLQSSFYATMADIETYKIAHGIGDYGKVIYYYKETCRYARKIGDENKIAAVMNNLGVKYRWRFETQKAINCIKKAIQITEKMGDQYGLATGSCNFGNLLRDKGDNSKAIYFYKRALVISKKIGYTVVTAAALLGIGQSSLAIGDYKMAKEYAQKALKIFNAMGWKERNMPALIFIGKVHQLMGDYTLAFRFYRKALKILRDIKYQNEIASSYVSIGSLFIEIGEFTKAKRHIENALNIAVNVDAKDFEIECYKQLCIMHIIGADCILAHHYYEKGMRVAKKIRGKYQIIELLILLSEICYQKKKYLKGIKTANKAIKMARQIGIKDSYAEALLVRAKNGQKHSAIPKLEIFTMFNEAVRLAEEIGNPEILWKVYFEYGKFLRNNNEYHKALDYYHKCNGVFKNVIGKIKNERYRVSYLNRPDRKVVDIAINEIRISLH